MIKNKTIFKPVLNWMSALAIIIVSPLCHAQAPVTVKALAVHYGGNIQYSYQVSNHTKARSIVTVNIGDRGKQAPDPVYSANTRPELSVFPVGSYWGPPTTSGDQRGTSLRLEGLFTNPPGWTASILGYEETTNFSVNWDNKTPFDLGILPGQTYNFSVTVPATNTDPLANYSTLGDLAYLNGHFTVRFAHSDATYEGPAFWAYTGPIVPIDTTPPSLTLSLSPNTLWPPNDKLVSVTAAITVKDNYDPAPEIKLESITASEPLAANDVQGAQFGTDDRQFNLVAKRAGTSLAGRTYTVTYSATDASGNKVTASATVTVPHDRSK
ncbi:MAG: hypothetical protein ACYC2E_03840 [Sulfuricella sp.]